MNLTELTSNFSHLNSSPLLLSEVLITLIRPQKTAGPNEIMTFCLFVCLFIAALIIAKPIADIFNIQDC